MRAATSEPSAASRVFDDVDHLSLVFAALVPSGARTVVQAAAVARAWRMQSRDERLWRALYLARWGPTIVRFDPPVHDLCIGQSVEFAGLTSRSDLNGKLGKLVAWHAASGRWVINPQSEYTIEAPEQPARDAIKVLPHNLTGAWRLRYRRRLHMSGLTKATEKLQVVTTARRVELVDAVELSFRSTGSQQVVRTECPLLPVEDDLGYFEATVSASSVGLTAGRRYGPRAPRPLHIGWEPTAYGYHSDDGSKWRHDQLCRPAISAEGTINGERFAAPFGNVAGRPDVVGCGVDFARGSTFFTKNGVLIGTAYDGLPAEVLDRLAAWDFVHTGAGLHPTVSLHEAGDECALNLGRKPFAFDVRAYAHAEERHGAVVGGGAVAAP